jgi:PAS domain S-box-containing protein
VPERQDTVEETQWHEHIAQVRAQLMELARDAILVRDSSDTILYWNRGAEELYGWSAQEAVGKVTSSLLQTRFPVSHEALNALLTTGQQWEGELVHTCKDGRQVMVESRQVVTIGPANQSPVILEINRDITRRKQTEVDQLRLAAIVESSDDAIVSKTLNGIITSWNLAAERMFGYSSQEAVGRHITLIIPPELRPEEDMILSKLRKGEHIDHFETVRMRKDGTRLDISLSISPIKNKAGQIIGASKIARDITESKRLRRDLQYLYQAVQQSRDQLDIILQGVADGIVVYDSHNRIIYANDAAARMTGFVSVQALMETPTSTAAARYEIIDEQRQPFPPARFPYSRVLAGEQEAEAIMGYRPKAEHQPERWAFLKSRPVCNERGEVSMVVTIIHDITERVAAEERKDTFISMASHELKTPITSLKGFTQVLQRRLTKQGDQQDLHYLSRMDAQINRLTKLVADLLDISRMQVGKLAFQKEPLDLDSLVDEIVENVQASTTTHEIVVEGRTGASILGDKDRLGQVLVNLLTNAVKYSPQADKVIVRLFGEHNQAIISVRDFGIGIDEAHHQQIFERFYQVNDLEERTYSGLGIGLYISKEIIDRHGGSITIKSRKGEGATFVVTLPLVEEKEKEV